jgi:endonuclease/exonuclease/phosphatase (EEP) superfamily protein YafD
VVANVHADPGENRNQLERAGYVLERFARGAPMVLAGDLNSDARSPALRALVARGWLEDSIDIGIDHILVRGLRVERPATRWEPERRDLVLDGGRPVRLSDHDPVDAVVAF